MKILFAGGVTGGHIAPGVALAEEVVSNNPGCEVLFASVANEVEERMIARRGLGLVKVTANPSGPAGKLLGIPAAWLRARRLLASFQPDVVVGLGGGASVGPALAAISSGTPLVLLEQNAIPGRATRRLAARAAQICCQFERAAEELGGCAQLTGSPIRNEIAGSVLLDKAEPRVFFGLDRERPTLLVMGGSQGAHAINTVMMEAARHLAGEVQVIHLAGAEDGPALAEAYRDADVAAHVTSFFETMHLAYAAADLALSRAGGMSIAELAVAGLPAILVPYPHAKDDHQRANARDAVQQGWAVMADPGEFDADLAADLIRSLLGDPTQLEAMERKALSSVRREAAEEIINTIYEAAESRGETVEAPTP